MKHIVTMVHEVEADSWDLAVEEVLREPVKHMVVCAVKAPGKRLVHVTISVLKEALEKARAGGKS